eukprot:IDg7159t1
MHPVYSPISVLGTAGIRSALRPWAPYGALGRVARALRGHILRAKKQRVDAHSSRLSAARVGIRRAASMSRCSSAARQADASAFTVRCGAGYARRAKEGRFKVDCSTCAHARVL